MVTTLAMQRPTVLHVPEVVGSAGAEAVDLAKSAGLELDPWQAFVLQHSLSERPDGKWFAFEVGAVLPRQNGKGGLLEARELAGLFLLSEGLIVHSAHQFDTSLEAFYRLRALIEDTPELDQKVDRVTEAHGKEGIWLKDGQRIRFRTRTKGGGRGFSADCLILDEAMMIPEAAHGALLPTLSARPNPQVWYTGSAVDQAVHLDGMVLARVRERGIAGSDPSLLYVEWSFDPREDGDERPVHPQSVTPAMAVDPDVWAAANPAMGIRISAEHIAKEQASMDPRTFAVERLGVGDWPRTDAIGRSALDFERWAELEDPASTIVGPLTLAFDVTPDRTYGSIGAAGLRSDGKVHVELVDRRPGTGWLAGRLRELRDRHRPAAVICDDRSPAASLVEKVGADTIGTTEYVRACGNFFDLIDDGDLRHTGGSQLNEAVHGAATRSLGDAWAWSRRSAAVDISPLVTVTIAADHAKASKPEVRVLT